jgi:hypothetical protein
MSLCSVMDLERYDLPDDLGPRPKLDPADEILLQVKCTEMEPLQMQLLWGAYKGLAVRCWPQCRSSCCYQDGWLEGHTPVSTQS